jgi:DNA repair protein RadC
MRQTSKATERDPQLSFLGELVFPELGDQMPLSRVRETPMPTEFIPIFAVKLVRAQYVPLQDRTKIRTPRNIANLVGKILEESDREQMIAVLVDTKNGVIGLHVVSVGDLSSAVVHPREVFKAAILANAASLILAHNHPSGDPAPSPEDIAVTKRIAEAGELLGIELLDHVVIGDAGRFVSLKEKGFF